MWCSAACEIWTNCWWKRGRFRGMALASSSPWINLVGLIYQKQMRGCFDYKELCCNGRPLSTRVQIQEHFKLYIIWLFSIAFFCICRFLASLVAVFGEFDISGDLEKKRSVTKNVKRIVVHREYDAATFENDLALLELESPIHYDTHIGKFFRRYNTSVVIALSTISEIWSCCW